MENIVILIVILKLQLWDIYRQILLAWRIPGTGEPGGLQPMGSYRVGHDSAAAAA